MFVTSRYDRAVRYRGCGLPGAFPPPSPKSIPVSLKCHRWALMPRGEHQNRYKYDTTGGSNYKLPVKKIIKFFEMICVFVVFISWRIWNWQYLVIWCMKNWSTKIKNLFGQARLWGALHLDSYQACELVLFLMPYLNFQKSNIIL